VQDHLSLRRAAHHRIIHIPTTPASLLGAAVIVVVIALAHMAGGTSAQEPGLPPATPVIAEAEQQSAQPDSSDAPSNAPTETQDPPTVPATEIPPTAPPTETPTTVPPTATIPPTATETARPATATTVPPTVAPTAPQATLDPTAPAVILPTTTPADGQPNTGPTATVANAPIMLSDRFDNPSMRLLGETKANETQISGRYEDGHYRLEINGPEVAPDLIALVRSPILVDASIHVSAQLEGTIQDRYVMATCREVEGYGGYRVYLSPQDGYFAITRFKPGALPTILQEGPADELIQGSERFEFDFSCTGYVLELKVNGETIGIAADNSFAAGTVSIGTGYFANATPGPVTALFRDLEVTGNIGMAGQFGPERQGQSPWGPARSIHTVPTAIRLE